MTSSTSGRCAAARAPEGEASKVMRALGIDSRIARNAGVVINTSPRLSRRTHRTHMGPRRDDRVSWAD